MEESELTTLMQRYQAGDAAAFDALFRAVSPQVHRFLVHSIRDSVLADDVLQEVFLSIHRARATYRQGSPVLPWIYAIARNAAADRARKAGRRAKREETREDLGDLPGAATSADGGDVLGGGDAEDPRMDAIHAALDALPPAQREVVMMLKVSDLSLAEVAKATGATVGSVKLRAHRAYETLRKKLGVKA